MLFRGKLDLFLKFKQFFFVFQVDSYNSRSKPFSPDLVRIENKVKNNEYSSLTQFHEDMRAMMETMQSEELMDFYHSAMKEVCF